MMRPAVRKTSLFAVLALASIASIAACGDDVADLLQEDPADGGLPDGTTIGPDGEIILPDGALADQATPDGALPDGALPDGADAGADAGEDSADAADGYDGFDGFDGFDGYVPDPPGPLSLTYKDYDYNHILSTGQSNAVASGARPFTTLPYVPAVGFTTTQPFTNKMFQTGVMTSGNCSGTGCLLARYVTPTSFVDLVEGDNFFDVSFKVETASSAMANLISQIGINDYMFGAPGRPARYPAKHDVLVSLHGRSGNKYVCLRKTAQTDPDRLAPNPVPGECAATLLNSFTEGMRQAQAGYDLAVAEGKTHVVRAVTLIHGESDHNGQLGDFPMRGSDGVAGKIKNYADALIEWQQDYEAGVKAITGQTEPVPLFVMGISGWTGPATYPGETQPPRYSPLAAQQHDAHVQAPGKVILVGPGYPIDQGTRGSGSATPLEPECLHQSIVGQRQFGEYFAKVYAKVVFKGEPWEPVRPKTVTRVADVVTVEYFVPVPPLVMDTTLVITPSGVAPYPAQENNGFEYRVGGHAGARISINSVVVSGPTTVTITLATTPVGANQRLIYGQNQRTFGQGCTGPGIQSNGSTAYAGGARGNLRDSDATPSRYTVPFTYPLYNWGVIFDVPVP